MLLLIHYTLLHVFSLVLKLLLCESTDVAAAAFHLL